MNFDGSDVATLLTGLNFVVGGGGITVKNGHLYWTEQGGLNENAIWRAELDGSNPTKLYENDGYMYGIAVVPELQSFSLLLGLSLLSPLVLRRRLRRVLS